MKTGFRSKNSIKQIGFFEARIIRKKGLLDGVLGLPRQDESGEWTSPYIQRELSAFREHAKRVWLQVEVDTAEQQIQAEQLQLRIIRIKENHRSLSGNLDVRYTGEEKLDSWIIQRRRKNDMEEIDHLEDVYHEIVHQIFEVENAARLYCLQIEDHTFGRLSIYWNGCLESNPSSNLPPVPILAHSNAEEVYMDQHKRNILPTSTADKINEEEENHG